MKVLFSSKYRLSDFTAGNCWYGSTKLNSSFCLSFHSRRSSVDPDPPSIITDPSVVLSPFEIDPSDLDDVSWKQMYVYGQMEFALSCKQNLSDQLEIIYCLYYVQQQT